MKSTSVRTSLSILVLMLVLPAQGWAAGLILEGAALRDQFIKVSSDKPGKWTAFHVNGGLDICELIILNEGKQCVFCGAPGKYLVMCNVADEPAVRVLKIEVLDGGRSVDDLRPLQEIQDPRGIGDIPPAPPEPGGSENPNPPESEEPGDTGPDYSQYHPLALEIFAQTNAYRQRHGLNALAIDPVLMESAQAWTEVMARTGRFNHSSSGRYRPGASENIAYGNSDATRTMSQWINSGGHRRNMLGSHGVMGIGVADGPRGRYWTQQFRGSGQGANNYSGGSSGGGRRRILGRRR